MPDHCLSATLALDADSVVDVRDLEVDVAINNAGERAVEIDPLPLSYAAAVLEVIDAAGQRVHGMPPSVPPLPTASDIPLSLAPHSSEHFSYRGSSLFHDPLTAGRYAIRFHASWGEDDAHATWAGTLDSGWVAFTVTNL